MRTLVAVERIYMLRPICSCTSSMSPALAWSMRPSALCANAQSHGVQIPNSCVLRRKHTNNAMRKSRVSRRRGLPNSPKVFPPTRWLFLCLIPSTCCIKVDKQHWAAKCATGESNVKAGRCSVWLCPQALHFSENRNEATRLRGERMYIVCLDCGKEFPYDWQQMKIVASGKQAGQVAA